MSEYFSNFPRILYDIDGTNSTNPEFSVAVNLLIRQKLRTAIVDDVSIYYPYVIPDSVTRPDILSFQIYGDVKFTWTIYLVNQIHDPYWEWPLDSKIFEKYIKEKYGSIAEAKNQVHHYEYIWQQRVEVTGTSDPVPERFVEVDYDTYLAVGENNRRIKYAFEYEQERNEEYRSINLIQPAFISSVLDEARGIFR
tara:strand:- start:217 stop:801 length:585 start_codon:yes stop_codon:yes gene_type:complete